jgi:hypothetical protein
MTPTPKLRFVNRVVPAPEHGEGIGITVRILQQWWEGEKWNEEFTQILSGEWRDIPLETEA